MKNHLDNFINGWIVGNFTPSLLNKDIEVGIQSYGIGDYAESHIHCITNEINIILSGLVKFKIKKLNSDQPSNTFLLSENEIITIPSGYVTSFLSITNSKILVIKDQSQKYDKVIYSDGFISD